MTGAIPWGQLMKDAKENPAADFTPMPPGEYACKITKVEVTKTKTQGETMFRMQAKVETGPLANRVTFPNIIVPGPTAQPKRAGYFINDLKSCGLTDTFIQAQPTIQQIADALHGKYVNVELEDGVYQGKKTSNVKRLKPATMVGGGAPSGAPAPAPSAAPPAPTYAPPAAAPQPQAAPQPIQYQPQQPPAPQPQAAPPAAAPQPQYQAPAAEAPAPQAAPEQPVYAPPAAAPTEAPQPSVQSAAPQQPEAPTAVPGPAPEAAAPPAAPVQADVPAIPPSPFAQQ